MTKLRVSASQIETASTCLRKWYLGKVEKLPQSFDRNKLLGEVGHGVLERFRLKQDLYPEGWTSPTDRFTGMKSPHHITTTEQALVKALCTKAIKEGVILIEPDGHVEREFGPKMKSVELIEGIDIHFIGFIDYCYGNVIEDHKFIGPNSGKYYGVAKLEKAIAMNLYAFAGYKEGFITDPTVWLRYNLFVKDVAAPLVSIKHVEKTKEEIFDFYENKIKIHFKPMVMAAKNCTSWEQVDNAMCRGKGETVCKKYSGCEYMDICLGKITVAQYRERFAGGTVAQTKENQTAVLERLQSGQSVEKPNKENSMAGFLQKIKSGAPSAPAAPAASTPAVIQPAVIQPAVIQPAVTAPAAKGPEGIRTKAPWAFDGCPMCRVSGTAIWGMNKKNEPCNICKMNSNAEKEAGTDRPVLEDFIVTVDPDGTISWHPKEQPAAVAVTVQPITATPAVKEDMNAKGGDTFVAPAADVLDEEPALVTEKVIRVSTPAPEPETEKTGFVVDKDEYNAERTGRFVMSYATIQNRSLRTSKKLGDASCVIHISELVELAGKALLEAANTQGAGAAHFLDLDYYLRRDLVTRNAKQIAEAVGSSTVDASNIVEASMEHVFCAAIERYASMVFGSRK